jgi:hypothetical protein
MSPDRTGQATEPGAATLKKPFNLDALRRVIESFDPAA